VSIDRSIYRTRTLTERGYSPYVCKYCNSFFWSRRSREDCGDAPCSDYTFLEVKTKRSLSYREARELFLRFFEKNGHTIIDPRPVAARWREDLYLTIASIVVFQPHVTSGLVPPPANPLVIAQPCIRLEDIDRVGLTFGRHLTNFTMGGHHAFNTPDKYIYWIDETVEYARRFFVEEVGVPEDELVFKESWWEGGGNAGPSFEVAVGGLEVATLVFMMYRTADGRYEEIPLRIVDTGYGIERIAWLTQKTPSAFHAVYGELVPVFFKKLGVEEPPREILYEALKASARLNPQEQDFVDLIVKRVAHKTGYREDEIKEMLLRAFDVFAVLDHSKTVAHMLADGIVPSNSGEGYLARLVIRRAIRRMKKLGADVSLSELVSLQLDYWSDLYPKFKANKHEVLDMVEHEEAKYREVLGKVPQIVQRYAQRDVGLNDLIELYDSQGIPPEILAEELEKRFGRRIAVPTNFYSIVASRHSKPPTLKGAIKSKLPEDVIKWSQQFKETKPLFHLNPYLREFTATVVGVYQNYLVLDATAFYPEGGGQLGDTGIIRIDDTEYRVLGTYSVKGVVVHVLDQAPPEHAVGRQAFGAIDWSKRYRRMKHHTATHILLGALRRVLGDHVWQAGAEKSEDEARLDITHHKMLTEEEIRRVEDLANRVVEDARRVNVYYMPRNEAEAKYGFYLYQGGVPETPIIRVVEIEGWDAQACFGTHVSITSEVGGIKIIGVEKIADGVVRLRYAASTALRDYADRLESNLRSIASRIGGSIEDAPKRVESILRELESVKRTLRAVKGEYVKRAVNEVLGGQIKVGSTELYVYRQEFDDKETLREVILGVLEKNPKSVVVAFIPLGDQTYIEISIGSQAPQNLDARNILKTLSRYAPVRAGGKRDHVTGVVEINAEKLVQILREALEPH